MWRNKGVRMGGEVMEEQDEEVFDDTDFYQQLLRDVIDSRNGERGGQDWMAAQKERKKKKNVDTKASKGRKLRYDFVASTQIFTEYFQIRGPREGAKLYGACACAQWVA